VLTKPIPARDELAHSTIGLEEHVVVAVVAATGTAEADLAEEGAVGGGEAADPGAGDGHVGGDVEDGAGVVGGGEGEAREAVEGELPGGTVGAAVDGDGGA
jgi:hypothetical protein